MYQLNLSKQQRTTDKNPETYRYKNTENKKPLSEPDTMKRHQSVEFPKHDKI